MTDFTIDYILNRAGNRYFGTNASMSVIHRIKISPFASFNELQQSNDRANEMESHPNYEQLKVFDWIHYTRYHPPRLSRPNRPGPVKRTPGRLPRIPFTPAQLEALEQAYQKTNYLSAEEANILAERLQLTNTRVKIWFQNRRARERREKKEKEDEGSYNTSMSSGTSSPELKIYLKS